MERKNIFYLLFVLLYLLPLVGKAQDPSFSQYEANPLQLNPAYSGTENFVRIGGNYRNLWPRVPGKDIPGPFSTYNLYGDIQFRNRLIGGAGVNVLQNYEGEGWLKHTGITGYYSWHLPTKHNQDFNWFFGIESSYHFLNVDQKRLTFTDQLHPLREEGERYSPYSSFHQQDITNGQTSYMDFGAGSVVQFNVTDKFSNELGFAVSHLVEPDISLNGVETSLPRKYTVHYSGGVEVLARKLYFSPKVLFEQQGPFTAYTGGVALYWIASHYNSSSNKMNYNFKPLYGSILYRNGKYYDNDNSPNANTQSVIFIIGHQGVIEAQDISYQVGLSYDQTFNGLHLKTAGAFELSFSVVLPPIKDTPDLCPYKGNAMGVF